MDLTKYASKGIPETKQENNFNTNVSDSQNTKAEGDEQDNVSLSENAVSSNHSENGSDVSKRSAIYNEVSSTSGSNPSSFTFYNQMNIQKRNVVNIYGEDTGPKLYPVKGSIVTPPIVSCKLPTAFEYLPICGRPDTEGGLNELYNKKIREFVGFDLNDEAYDQLSKFCSPDNLKTGKELKMSTNSLSQGSFPSDILKRNQDLESDADSDEDINLCIVKKCKLRKDKDHTKLFVKRLKYRGLRLLPPTSQIDESHTTQSVPEELLQPGKDLVFRVKFYRPFSSAASERNGRSRHSLFSCDVVMLGRQLLSELRDRVVCLNDSDMRVDVSSHPHQPPRATAKELFPSGFMFINNVFYVDTRAGCADRSAGVRRWAAARGIGVFPHCGMDVALSQLRPRLGHPEVYVHQGNCEHLFTFSDVRLLGPSDPLRPSQYPATTALAQSHAVYCTTCAEFCAKWIVCGCTKVPFDPAFFCDTCLKLYLYKDGKKTCDFRLYSYRGNEINTLKPQG